MPGHDADGERHAHRVPLGQDPSAVAPGAGAVGRRQNQVVGAGQLRRVGEPARSVGEAELLDARRQLVLKKGEKGGL